jgi:hypothetical protein
MKPLEEIKRLIHESEITTGPEADERILHDALNELEKRRRDNRAPLDAALWRALMKNKMIRFGTAFAVIIAAVVAFQFLGNPFGTKLTFANAIKPIMDAKTAAFDIVVGPEDGSTPVVHDEVMGSRIRRTVAGAEMAPLIIDLESGRVLLLDGASMEARYMNINGLTSIQNNLWNINGLPPIPNYLKILKNGIQILQEIPDFTVKNLGRKQLDGHEAVGFFASHPKVDITIWADVDTGLPVRIESNEGQLRIVLKNVKFDLPLKEDQFSMEAPAGYTVQEDYNLDLQAGTEAKFIEGLRLIAESFNDGFFPEGVSIDALIKWMPEFGRRLGAMNLSKVEAEDLSLKLAESFFFIRFFRGEGEWTYRGKGVRLGETETPIFWYRPENSKAYRVIYGDLHVEDVSPENLPK